MTWLQISTDLKANSALNGNIYNKLLSMFQSSQHSVCRLCIVSILPGK